MKTASGYQIDKVYAYVHRITAPTGDTCTYESVKVEYCVQNDAIIYCNAIIIYSGVTYVYKYRCHLHTPNPPHIWQWGGV